MMNTAPIATVTPMRSTMIDRTLSRREPDRRHAPTHDEAPVSSTAIAFDVSRGGHAITMTVSDPVSGDVLRKLVYDYGGVLRSAARAPQGHLIDIFL
jgi:hypothetical protein